MIEKKDLKDKYLERVEELVEFAATNDLSERSNYIRWKTSSFNILRKLPLEHNDYYINFQYYDEEDFSFQWVCESRLGVLEALRDDIKAGVLESGIELVKAEVFTDFIDMAEHLLDNDYKDPAASLLGAVLEIELRNLCKRQEINVKNSDDISCLNGKLKDKDVYNQPKRLQIGAWKKIRDSAAHGKFDEYTKEEVKNFLSGLRSFINEFLG